MSDSAQINIDGASRGNPGPAAFGFVIQLQGGEPIEGSGTLGRVTNNVAEYTALVRALERSVELGVRDAQVRSDSELLVKQMNGQYRVKSADLLDLYEQAKDLCREIGKVKFSHVYRAQNARADQLCNEALDGGGKQAKPAKTKTGKAKQPTPVSLSIRSEAIQCLESAARAWARGNPQDPPVEAVWDQIWSVLEENNMVPKPR